MKRKPRIGERLSLLAWSQKSRAGFAVSVECLDPWDRNETLLRTRPLAKDCAVLVKLPCGGTLTVTRDDLEPEES